LLSNDLNLSVQDERVFFLSNNESPANSKNERFWGLTGAYANCSDKTSSPLGRDVVVVSCFSMKFKVDLQAFLKEKGNIIVGVLSSSFNVERRNVIRSTWANGRPFVFFVVAGAWEQISKEFHTTDDLIWIDVKEEYHKITYKSAAFFAVVDRVTRELGTTYDYAIKTDDDSYVALDRIEMFLTHLHKKNAVKYDYIGKCNAGVLPIRNREHKYYTSLEEYPEKVFPTYCQGCGFIASSSFVRCLSSHHNIASVRYLKHEDAFIGLLAQRCGVTNILSINENHLRQFRTGWNHGDSTGIEKERQRIISNGKQESDEELPMAEMAARMIQHRINSDADMVRHYKSHFDPRLIVSPHEVKVGDFIEYYVDDENGWQGADILNVTNIKPEKHERKDKAGKSSEWLKVALNFRLAQEVSSVDFIPFLGTWRMPYPISSGESAVVNNSTKIHGVSTGSSKMTRQKKRNFNDISEKHSSVSKILKELNITQNKKLFSVIFYQLLEEYFGHVEADHSSKSNRCEQNGAEAKYTRILKKAMVQLKDKKKSVDGDLWFGLQPCPLILLFYYEEISARKMKDFTDFYDNFNSECIKFAVPWDFIDSPQIKAHEKNTDFQFIWSRARYSDQNRVINDALDSIRNSCGPHCLVSVNDMDHYLVWHFRGGSLGSKSLQPESFHKYETYPDAVTLYMYSFLTAPGCGNKVGDAEFPVVLLGDQGYSFI